MSALLTTCVAPAPSSGKLVTRVLAIFCLGVGSLLAQGARGDSERARNLRKLTENKVYRDRVQPHWLPGNTHFWYQVKTGADTHEFVLVDAEHGVWQTAFDHARLAKALAAAGVKAAHADRLPLEKLDFKLSDRALEFHADGKGWRCDLQTYELREQPSTRDEPMPAFSPQDAPRASTRTGPFSDEWFAQPWSLNDVRWEPDSGRFTFVYNQRGHQVLRIVAIDAKTGEARAIVDEQSPTFINYSGHFFAEYLDGTGEIIWMSERDGWNHLYLYDAKSGQVKNQITRGEWVVRGVDRVDRDKRQVWFRAGGIRPGQDPYYLHYCRVNFDGSGLVILTEGDGTHTDEFSPDRQYFVDTYSRVDLPPVSELRRADDGRRVCELERADWRDLLAAGWRAPEPFVAKGRDDETDIYGIINRPTGFDPQKKYPVIESIYAGPQGSFVPKGFSSLNRMQELSELGFIVVQIDGMGTAHRSKKFHDVCWKNLADAGFPDRILWMKAGAAKYPSMDLTRVGIYGTSAGGQNALGGLLTHGDFYQAGVADCGCHDNRMDKIWWNEPWMGWPIGPHYAEQSNVTLAHKLQGKLLLMVGEMDKNVDPASTMQVVNALIKADKDFEMLVIPGAGHGVTGTPYGQRRLREFFVRHLLGAEQGTAARSTAVSAP